MRPSIGDGMLPLDIEKLRAETPGVEHRVHLNNAGAGLMPKPVLQAMTDHLELESLIGGYEAEEAKKEAGITKEAMKGDEDNQKEEEALNMEICN